MTNPIQTVVVNGSPNTNSKTAALADLVANSLSEMLPTQVDQINVYELDDSFARNWDREEVSGTVAAAFKKVEAADLIIAASPVYRGSYSGMFKHFFDMVDQYALANKPVFLVATGGSERHALVIEHAMRPLFAFFQANVLPVGVYATSGDFSGTTLMNPEIYGRIEIGLLDALPILKKSAPEDVAN